MKECQIKGYYFEEIVKNLMKKTGYITVETGDIPGRGANHQIDSYGKLSFSIPFIYPVRLISEAKWYKTKIGLSKIRDFVGVMKDISENYFVPAEYRTHRDSNLIALDRFTDCGAYFSVTPFTTDAQNYAWAQGIYLISFNTNNIFISLSKKADELIKNDILNNEYLQKNLTKRKIAEIAQQHFQTNEHLKSLFDNIYSYIGILDGVYPVFITANRDFNFDPTAPDEIDEKLINQATKEYRLENEDSVDFRFNYKNIIFEFTVPSNTSKRIIDSIENTYKGKPFSYIDIPIEIRSEKGRFRRIYKINLAEKGENIVSKIKRLSFSSKKAY